MDSILFSVITVTYNAETTLQRTLESVERQSFVSRIEHIIIDGASTDNTLPLIDAYRDRNPGMRLIVKSERDRGIYDAMNKGLMAASGEFVCFLNAGDRFHCDSLIEDIFSGRDVAGVGVIYGNTDIVDNQGVFISPRRLAPPQSLSWKSFRSGMLVCHQSFYARRDLCEPYDLRYRFSSDFDWCIRVMKKAKADYTLLYIKEPVFTDYLSEGMTTRNRMKSLRERFRIMSRHYGFVSTLSFHCWFVLRLLLKH